MGQQFSVTRERIRQIEGKALRKLKHLGPSRATSWTANDRIHAYCQQAGLLGPAFLSLEIGLLQKFGVAAGAIDQLYRVLVEGDERVGTQLLAFEGNDAVGKVAARVQ